MIAKADFNDRESLVRLLEQRAGEDHALLGSIEFEDAAEDEFVRSEVVPELADNTESAKDAVDASDCYDSEDMVVPEEHEWTPPPLSDVSDYEDDGQEAASSPQYDPDANYPWIDRIIFGADKANVPNDAPADTANEVELPSDPIERLQVLVTAAKYGDESAVQVIRDCLDDHPEIWQSVGDLAAHAESMLIGILADGNAMVVESMEREIKRLKAELAEGEPSPLERLTIQRIVAAWLHAQYVDRATLAADAAGSRAAAWGKRQEWAERRYQMAIKSLDTVRRLRPRRASKPSVPADARATQGDSALRADEGRATDNSRIDGEVKEGTNKANGFDHHNRIKKFMPEAAVPAS